MGVNNDLYKQIKDAEKEGWKLCVGCIKYRSDEPCPCGINTRKLMGIPPEKVKA